MSETTEITCDGCGRDLTYTNNCEDYRLILASQPKGRDPAHAGMPVTAMAIWPPINRAHHFCNQKCLGKWCAPKDAP